MSQPVLRGHADSVECYTTLYNSMHQVRVQNLPKTHHYSLDNAIASRADTLQERIADQSQASAAWHNIGQTNMSAKQT